MENQSTVTEFLLMGFDDNREGQILHFVIFFSIYIVALIGNVLIIVIVSLNPLLHTPVYFFLVNLSLSDVCFISTTVPKSMATALTHNKMISFYGCMGQVFFVITFAGADLAIFTFMAFDRYVAICHPLRYSLIMNWNICAQMAATTWISSVMNAVLQASLTSRLNFCASNTVEQFFCDIPQLQKISCSDPKVNQIVNLSLALTVNSFCILCIFVSYGYILSAVLKITSVQGRYKAFSTCTPHLMVFSLFILTAVFSYFRPKELSSPTVDLLSAVLYAVLPPVLNPLIYSLRNKDLQEAMHKLSKQISHLIKDK